MIDYDYYECITHNEVHSGRVGCSQ